MNPDTKITEEQIKAICAHHGIPYLSYERITIGFLHEVHRLNNDLVIKLFNTEDERNFRTEAALLSSTLPFLKPKLIARSQKTADVDRCYTIMSYVPGKSLGTCWHLASNEQREKLIQDICRSLQLINQINPSDAALEVGDSWRTTIHKKGIKLASKLQSKSMISEQKAEKALRTIANSLDLFTDTILCPTYWDVHFDNFIVDDNFELRAIIDLENVQLAALDYPLFIIQKQMDEPEKFLREADEAYADKKDYQNLKSWYQKYYPEMFAYQNLNERLRIYRLLDTLHLLVDWGHVKELHIKLDTLIDY